MTELIIETAKIKYLFLSTLSKYERGMESNMSVIRSACSSSKNERKIEYILSDCSNYLIYLIFYKEDQNAYLF